MPDEASCSRQERARRGEPERGFGARPRPRGCRWVSIPLSLRGWLTALVLLSAGLSAHAGAAEPTSPNVQPSQPSQPSITPGGEAVPSGRLVRPPAGAGRLLLNGTVTGVRLVDRSFEFRTTNGLQRLVVTTNSHLLRAGQPQKFEDIQPGDQASALLRKRPDGSVDVIALRLSARPGGPGNGKRIGPPVPNPDLPRE